MTNRESEWTAEPPSSACAPIEHANMTPSDDDEAAVAAIWKLLGRTVEMRTNRLVMVLQLQHADVLAACMHMLINSGPQCVLDILHTRAGQELDALASFYNPNRADDDYLKLASPSTTATYCPTVWCVVRRWMGEANATILRVHKSPLPYCHDRCQ